MNSELERAALFDDLEFVKANTTQSNCNKVLAILIKGMAPACIKYICRRFKPDKSNINFLHKSLKFGHLELPEWLHRKGFAMTKTAYYYATFLKRKQDSYCFKNDEKYVLATVISQCEWLLSKGIQWDTKIYKILVDLRLYRIAIWFIRQPFASFKKACEAGQLKLAKKIHRKYGSEVLDTKSFILTNGDVIKWLNSQRGQVLFSSDISLEG